MTAESESHLISPDQAGKRLDVWLAERPGAASRHQAQLDIEAGRVRVNGATRPSRYRLREGDRIEIESRPLAAKGLFEPAAIELDIRYEDEHLLVINKPAGLVVHPAPGHAEGTLANALAAHAGPEIMNIGGAGRCGIVHRLDKLTSGLILAAKTERAHEALTDALAERAIRRIYLGLALGNFREAAGVIEKPIGRRPGDRKRMGIVARGRAARTSYKVLMQAEGIALLLIQLHTGRTHQIRVHLQSVGRPVLGDAEYGYTKPRSLQMLRQDLRNRIAPIWPERQMLHAAGLSFSHPITAKRIQRLSELPEDMLGLTRKVFEPYGLDHLKAVEEALAASEEA